jgi:excisionase family DNA binding protein
MNEKPVKLLTAKEVCELMRISLDTLHKWFGMGLKGYRVERVIRIPENELWRFLEAHRAEEA